MRFIGIDPSTKTGFVALDSTGKLLIAKEITGVGKVDPNRMRTLIQRVRKNLREGDVIVMESFPFNTMNAITIGGVGWGIRMTVDGFGLPYKEANPYALKKFVGITGSVPKEQKKQVIMDAVHELYGIRFTNDNICDAYVLAQIARSIHTGETLYSYQDDVIQKIINPPPKKPKKKKKKGTVKKS